MKTRFNFWHTNCGNKVPGYAPPVPPGQPELTDKTDPGMPFIAALNKLPVGGRSGKKPAATRDGPVFSKINEKLNGTGEAVPVNTISGKSVQAYKTSVPGIFRQATSNNQPAQFLVCVSADDPHLVDERTLEEVQTHFVLESYLKTRSNAHGASTRFEGDFITLEDISQSPAGSTVPPAHAASNGRSAQDPNSANGSAAEQAVITHYRGHQEHDAWSGFGIGSPSETHRVSQLNHTLPPMFPTDRQQAGVPEQRVLSGNDVLRLRENPVVQEWLPIAFERMKSFYGIEQTEGSQQLDAKNPVELAQWLTPESPHCKHMTTMIRSMSLLGMSVEARGLHEFLKQAVVPDRQAIPDRWKTIVSGWDEALRAPVPANTASGRIESYLFPDKSTVGDIIDPTLDVDDPAQNKKRVLFQKQQSLFDFAEVGSPDRPLLAHFSSAEAIARYKDGRHLKELVRPVETDSQAKLVEGFYFEGSPLAGQPGSEMNAPDPERFQVHVDFANTCFGGAWKNPNAFAQEEVAFLENAGLAAVAQQAERFVSSSPGVKTVTHPRFGAAFSTRLPDASDAQAYGTPAPIVIENAVRVANFSSYGAAAAQLSTGEAEDKLTLARATSTNWLAIAAPDLRGRERRVTTGHETFTDLFSIAHAGFAAARDVAGDRILEIHTGKLGGGVFQNDVMILTAAQLLAAKLLGIKDISFHGYEKNAQPEKDEIAKFELAKEHVDRCYQEAITDTSPPAVWELVENVWLALLP